MRTGEIELIGDDVGGIAVYAAARVAAQAGVNEVWTSRTVTDLVAGYGASAAKLTSALAREQSALHCHIGG